MRLFAHLLFWYVTGSMTLALVIARLLRSLPPPPPPARSVDDWAPVTVDAEFWALIRDGVQR